MPIYQHHFKKKLINSETVLKPSGTYEDDTVIHNVVIHNVKPWTLMHLIQSQKPRNTFGRSLIARLGIAKETEATSPP